MVYVYLDPSAIQPTWCVRLGNLHCVVVDVCVCGGGCSYGVVVVVDKCIGVS